MELLNSSTCRLLWHDPGTGFAFEGTANVFRIGDQRLFAAILEEPDDGLNLWRHGTFGEMFSFRKIGFGFRECHFVEPLLIRFAKVDGNLFYGSSNEEQIRANFLCEQ